MKKLCVAALTVILLSGCVSISATRTAQLPQEAVVVVMPPHDVVQSGEAHREGSGSGKRLQQSVSTQLAIACDCSVSSFKATDEVSHVEDVIREEAISRALEMKAGYVLLLTLGEFRDAAPMTFRSDYVTLSDGALIDTATGQDIWTLNTQYRIEQGNLGDYEGMIDKIAKDVAKSITK